jgi:hypothetical protein
LDTTALTTFVNEDVTKADTDFSTDTSGTFESGLDRLANQSIGGRSGVLKGTIQATTEEHRLIVKGVDMNGKTHRLQTSVYIPSGQSGQTVDGFRIENGGYEVYATTTTQDAWVDIDVTWSSSGNANVFIKFLPSGGAENWTGNGTDEVYIGDVTITQTTADGAVTTWYDQSGNGNDATNSTESEQPLVVSGGSVTQLNSRAAINGDGVDDVLSLGTGLDLSSGYSIFQVVQVPSANTYGITISSSDVSNFSRTMMFGGLYRFSADGTNYDNYGSSGNKGEQCLWSSVVDGSGNLDTNRNGSAYGSQITGVTGTFELDIIGTNIGVNSFEFFQELIVFNSDQSSNRTGMETNINDHFSIYP